jgi:hypothetical protein
VDDAGAVGLREPFADLAGDADRLADRQGADAVDEALEVLAGDVLHGDVVGRALAAEVVHAADVAVGDRPCQAQLVAEALDRPFVGGDLGVEELEGQLLPDLGVVDLVDAAHAALAEVLDHLVAPGEGLSGGKLTEGRGGHDQGGGLTQTRRRGEGRAAAAAEAGLLGILGLAFRTAHFGLLRSLRRINPRAPACQRALSSCVSWPEGR